MKQEEEIEVSDELKSLKEVSQEIAQHTKRLAALQDKGVLGEVLGVELASTVLPLLSDLAKAQLLHAAFMEDWLTGVDEAVEDGGQEPDLTDEEINILQFLLARLRDFLQGAMSASADAPPLLKQGFLEIEVKLNKGEKILARLVEDGEEEDEEGDTDEDGADSEGDDDDTPDDE